MTIKKQINAAKKRIERDKAQRLRIGKSWKAKFRKLEKTGLSRASFCHTYKFNTAMMLRYVHGQRAPSWDTIAAVSGALEVNGV